MKVENSKWKFATGEDRTGMSMWFALVYYPMADFQPRNYSIAVLRDCTPRLKHIAVQTEDCTSWVVGHIDTSIRLAQRRPAQNLTQVEASLNLSGY